MTQQFFGRESGKSAFKKPPPAFLDKLSGIGYDKEIEGRELLKRFPYPYTSKTEALKKAQWYINAGKENEIPNFEVIVARPKYKRGNIYIVPDLWGIYRTPNTILGSIKGIKKGSKSEIKKNLILQIRKEEDLMEKIVKIERELLKLNY